MVTQVVLPWGCAGGIGSFICRDNRGVFGAEMDVPRSVNKRNIFIPYTVPLLYLYFVSSLQFVPWFGRSYCTLDICPIPSFEAWMGLTFSKTFLVMMNAMIVCDEVRLN